MLSPQAERKVHAEQLYFAGTLETPGLTAGALLLEGDGPVRQEDQGGPAVQPGGHAEGEDTARTPRRSDQEPGETAERREQ